MKRRKFENVLKCESDLKTKMDSEGFKTFPVKSTNPLAVCCKDHRHQIEESTEDVKNIFLTSLENGHNALISSYKNFNNMSTVDGVPAIDLTNKKKSYDDNVPCDDEAILKSRKKLGLHNGISSKKNIFWGLFAFLIVASVSAEVPTKVGKSLNNEERNSIKKTFVDYFGVKVKFGDLFENDSKAFDALSAHQIDLALKNNSSGLNEAFNETLHQNVVLTWQNCTEALKHKILSSSVDFQGKSVELGKILDFDSKVLFDFSQDQIKNLIEGKSFEIGSKFSSGVDFFIERKFKIISKKNLKSKRLTDLKLFVEDLEENENGWGRVYDGNEQLKRVELSLEDDFEGSGNEDRNEVEIPKDDDDEGSADFDESSEKILTINDTIIEASTEGIFLLIDSPESGKSTAFKILPDAIKNLHPDFFVAFVDLKELLESFDSNSSPENFIGEKILKLEGLDLKIFIELFSKGKVALIWDGFNGEKFLLELFVKIKSETQNFQFLSSRPEHQEEDLSKALSAKVFSLVSLSEKDREEFYEKALEDLGEENRKLVKEKIQRFVDDIEEWNDKSTKVNNLRMLREICEVFKDHKTLDAENVFKVCEKLVEKQISSIDLTFNEIHQRFALKFLFYDKFPEVTSLDIFKQISPPELSSFGLVTTSSHGRQEFIHKIFLKFFIVKYIVDKVFIMKETASEEEIQLRIKLVEKILDEDAFDGIEEFLFSYLKNDRKIQNWSDENLKNGRKALLSVQIDFEFGFYVNSSAEIRRRLAMKDYEGVFLKKVNDQFGNVFRFLKEKFTIFVKDEGELLKVSNDRKLIFDEFSKNHMRGIIYHKIWNRLKWEDYSLAYFINRETGLNLNEKKINEIARAEYFDLKEILKFTKMEEKKMNLILIGDLFGAFVSGLG